MVVWNTDCSRSQNSNYCKTNVNTRHGGGAQRGWWVLQSRGYQSPLYLNIIAHKTCQFIRDSIERSTPPPQTGWNLRGLLRRTDSVLLRSLHLLAGEPLHSASSPRCRWCMLSNVPPFDTALEPSALPLQQLPLVATATWPWTPLWFCPLLTWKAPEAPFFSIIDLALSMAAASLAQPSLA